MDIRIDTNFPEVQRALSTLQSDLAGTVLARAVNRTIDIAKTAMSREIRAEFNLSKAKVDEKLTVRRARFSQGTLSIEATLLSRDPTGRRRGVNLVNFEARQTSRGLVARIKKRGRAVLVSSRGFIGNKGRTAFQRVPGTVMKSRGRYAGTKHAESIEALQTIDVPQMFNTRRVNERVLVVLRQRFPEVFEREARFALSRWGR